MKILRISLRNIASLAGTHTVDFTQEPLRSAGLFSICGPTGSGKSTLLDALCLALYEQTPRLVLARGVKLPDGGEMISQKDPGNLLRRGTGDGYAEVAFVGVDGVSYTARWTIRRARGKPDGSLQNAEMTLFQGNISVGGEGIIEQGGKKSEVLPVIEAKIGLSYEQFTRAVLLAQNDFATFLKADDRERAEILQALTGTQRFEAISIAVFERSSKEREQISAMESRLLGHAPLPAEERTLAENSLSAAEEEVRALLTQFALHEAHLAWFKRGTELSTVVRQAELALAESQKAREDAQPRRRILEQTEEVSRGVRSHRDAETRLQTDLEGAEAVRKKSGQEHEKTLSDFKLAEAGHVASVAALTLAKTALDTAQPLLRQARDLDSKLPPLRNRLAALTVERTTIELEVKTKTEDRDRRLHQRQAAQKELIGLEPRRVTLAPIGPFAKDATAWLDRLERAAIALELRNKAQAELAQRITAEREHSQKVDSERRRAAELGASLEKAIASYKKAQEEAEKFDPEKIAGSRREADVSRTALLAVEKNRQELRTVLQQSEGLQKEIADFRTKEQADLAISTLLKAEQIPSAKREMDSSKRAASLAKAAVSKATVALREELSTDQPCPVCGAVEHPYAGHPPDLETVALRALQEDCQRKEDKYLKLLAQEESLAAIQQTRAVQIAQKEKALSALNPRLEAARSARNESPAALAILGLPEGEIDVALAAQLELLNQAIATAEAQEASRRTAEKARDEFRVTMETVRDTHQLLQKAIGELAIALATAESLRVNAANALKEADTALQERNKELIPLFKSRPDFQSIWETGSKAARSAFSQLVDDHQGLERRAAELEILIREGDVALAPAQEALSRAEASLKSKKDEEAKALAEFTDVKLKRAAFFESRSADLVEEELTKAFRQASDSNTVRANELNTADKRRDVASAALKAIEDSILAIRQRQVAAAILVDQWLSGFSERSARVLDRSALDAMLAVHEDTLKHERVALEKIENAVRIAEGALTAHKESLDRHALGRPTTDEEATVREALVAIRGTKESAEAKRDAAKAVLLGDDQRRATSLQLTSELERRKESTRPWERLNDLIGSADGAKFRNIAQRRTLDILLGYANRQLDLLASRYRLERLPESLNLIVVDRDMGDERRSVHSLSGGESFLVALALALGLASLTSNRLRIESLFIDEGFGSLDPETLGIAMGALMRLESQGRKVGVISHVSEMAEAIPVQIRVEKGRSGASRLSGPGVAGVDPLVLSGTEGALDAGRGLDPQAVAAQILAILQREQLAGISKVSARSLREQIGCSSHEFQAGRELLGGQVVVEGKSLKIVSE